MKQNKQILFILLVGMLTSACTSSRSIVPPDAFGELKAKTPVTAKMIRYDDPKLRNWRWLGTYPERWDLVVYRNPSEKQQLLLARVIGLPGEKLAIQNGNIQINGKPLNLPKALADAKYQDVIKQAGPVQQDVKDDHYYLLSDFRDRQHDSRKLGVIEVWDIIGRLRPD